MPSVLIQTPTFLQSSTQTLNQPTFHIQTTIVSRDRNLIVPPAHLENMTPRPPMAAHDTTLCPSFLPIPYMMAACRQIPTSPPIIRHPMNTQKAPIPTKTPPLPITLTLVSNTMQPTSPMTTDTAIPQILSLALTLPPHACQ